MRVRGTAKSKTTPIYIIIYIVSFFNIYEILYNFILTKSLQNA